MIPAIKIIKHATVVKMTNAGTKAAAVGPKECPAEYEYTPVEVAGKKYMMVNQKLWDMLLAHSTAYEAGQRTDALTTANLSIRRLKGQVQGLMGILKTKLGKNERIPAAAWAVFNGSTSQLVNTGDE